MNYIYKLTTRGLCSELNALLGFYESIINEECKVFIDGSASQYFKDVSIYDVFDFPCNFVKEVPSEATIISSNKWRKAACRNYKCSLSSQICLDFFTLNRSFQDAIDSKVISLKLPDDYNCLFIRRGDKVGEALYRWTERTGKNESRRFEVEDYIQKINNKSLPVFIMTDDYASILEAHEHNVNITTLTTADQTGHSTDLDTDNGRCYGMVELVQFFSEIQIAKHSQQFIGTGSSNIYRYIEAQCSNNSFISLD
tara:strand:- start:140 stop:901 length:762 start_codon:yes stop_codon:yes gene_type:complete